MRKLASIQTVNAVEPIPNADAIEKIRVLGWWVVVKKGEHKVGDRVVYCEIDSLLPERPEFEFLRASSFKPAQTDASGAMVLPAGFRIKTVKLRGQVSQGICFPLTILPPGAPTEEGADVTELLGRPQVGAAAAGRHGRQGEGRLPRLPAEDGRDSGAGAGAGAASAIAARRSTSPRSWTARRSPRFCAREQFGICSRNLWMDETDETNVLVRVARGLRLEEKLRSARERLGFDLAHPGRGDRAGHPEEQVRVEGGNPARVQRAERRRLPARWTMRPCWRCCVSWSWSRCRSWARWC